MLKLADRSCADGIAIRPKENQRRGERRSFGAERRQRQIVVISTLIRKSPLTTRVPILVRNYFWARTLRGMSVFHSARPRERHTAVHSMHIPLRRDEWD